MALTALVTALVTARDRWFEEQTIAANLRIQPTKHENPASGVAPMGALLLFVRCGGWLERCGAGSQSNGQGNKKGAYLTVAPFSSQGC